MPLFFEEISTITGKGQTTVPKAVRQALGVDYGGSIAFRVDEHGVTIRRAEAEHEDPALDRFLTLLAKDFERRPEAIAPIRAALEERMARATEGVEVDIDAPIEGDVDL